MSKYNLPLPWKLFHSLMCIASLSLAIGYLLSNQISRPISTIGSPFWVLLAGYYFFRLFDHLIIDESGFQYRTLGTVYSGKWSDAQRLAKKGIREGVYIPKARLTSGNNWNTPPDLFVPLSPFVPKWQESLLKRKINKAILQTKNEIINH